MDQFMQFLASAGLLLCFMGACVLAWCLNGFIKRVANAFDEVEKSINAINQGNSAGAHNHLGQIVKLTPPIAAARNMTNAGLGLIGVGTALQFIQYVWA